ncbi:STM3941 family protein [Nocardioides sp. NPDC087217]|uniref:STM3941 family protein n=1 Tax=Nocardioides sp. NPDC087217 TaxID=3364335 RepID=UPI003804C81D
MSKSKAAASRLWDEKLAADGRVEFATSKKRPWLMTLACLAFTGIGLGVVLFGSETEAQAWGWATVVFFGVVCTPAMVLQAVRTSVVVVDADGVRPSVGRWHGTMISWPDLVPWDHIEGTGTNDVQGTRFVILYITDEFEREWLAERGLLLRGLMRVNRAMQGTASLALPSNLHGDVNEIANWIERLRHMRRTRP